jgi:glycosyltransferase involved in cell wall biosynthesis
MRSLETERAGMGGKPDALPSEPSATAPRVVAMVPTYNGGKWLAETLASLAGQQYPELRVIVSDDASTDDTWAICETFAAQDSRFKIVRQPTRLGWIDNSNSLLELVDAEYAFFAPHDDWFDPAYVGRMIEALEAAPDAVLAFADTVLVANGEAVVTATAERTVEPASRVRRGLRYVLGDDWQRWMPFRGVVRTEALQRIGGLRTSSAGEFEADGRWLLRLHLLGRFVRVPEPLCRKLTHRGSLHRTWPTDRRSQLAQQAAYAREIVDAQLTGRERMALLAAVAAIAATWLLPQGVREPAQRKLALLAY